MPASLTRLQSAHTQRHEAITGQGEQSAVQEKPGCVSWKCKRLSMCQIEKLQRGRDLSIENVNSSVNRRYPFLFAAQSTVELGIMRPRSSFLV